MKDKIEAILREFSNRTYWAEEGMETINEDDLIKDCRQAVWKEIESMYVKEEQMYNPKLKRLILGEAQDEEN